MCSTSSLLSARSGSDCVVRMNTIFFLDRDLDNSSSKDLTPPLFLAKCKFYRTRLRAVSAANGSTAGGGGSLRYSCYLVQLLYICTFYNIYAHHIVVVCTGFELRRRAKISYIPARDLLCGILLRAIGSTRT